MTRAIIWSAVSTIAQTEDDKLSLPQQESDARAVAAAHGWQIVDVLTVPGHSRWYIDIHECNTDMLAQGISAFDRLLKHWQARDFDMLIVRDGNRFARTQTLHAYCVEQTIRKGARLYSLADGIIDDKNFRMFIAMNGYKSASEVDFLVSRRKEAAYERAGRGLLTNAAVPTSHVVVRDSTSGRGLYMKVDESKRRLFDDAATLILEGVAWNKIEQELFARFGHAAPLYPGEPLQPTRIYSLIRNPVFWGHIALHHRGRTKRDGKRMAQFGDWIMEPGHPIPDGVTIYYNVTEAVYTGDLADAVKAEVRRRSIAVTGGASSYRTQPFAALIVCNECNCYLTTHGRWQRGREVEGYLKCETHWHQSPTRPDCSQRKAIPMGDVRRYLDARLREMVASTNPDALIGELADRSAVSLPSLATEISACEERIRRLIRKQALADDSLGDLYAGEIARENQTLLRLRAALEAAESGTGTRLRHQVDRARAYQTVVELSVDVFWQQPSRFINQVLHQLFGEKCLSVRDGKIVELVDRPLSRTRRKGGA